MDMLPYHLATTLRKNTKKLAINPVSQYFNVANNALQGDCYGVVLKQVRRIFYHRLYCLPNKIKCYSLRVDLLGPYHPLTLTGRENRYFS